MVEMTFVFSMIWSVCASVDEEGRKKIDSYLREIEGSFPNKVGHTRSCPIRPVFPEPIGIPDLGLCFALSLSLSSTRWSGARSLGWRRLKEGFGNLTYMPSLGHGV